MEKEKLLLQNQRQQLSVLSAIEEEPLESLELLESEKNQRKTKK